MIFKAYFDESDTHGPKPEVIMGALLGNSRQWRLFERRLREFQRRDRFTIFHGKEFKARKGEFAGWSDAKADRLVRDLADTMRRGLMEVALTSLPWDRYQSEYRGGHVPQGMPLDSQYGACFRSVLQHFVQQIMATKQDHKLHVVIEDGHKNVGDTVRIFNEVKAELNKVALPILRTITVAKKEELPLLMVADFQAHLWSLSQARLRSGLPGYNDMAKGAAPKGEASLNTLLFPPGYFHRQKAEWEDWKKFRMEQWRRNCDAKLASSASAEEPPA